MSEIDFNPGLNDGGCGAGAETLILVTGALGKVCTWAQRPKLAMYTQKNKNRGSGIWCWDPHLSSGYQNCDLGTHRLTKSFWGKLQKFLESLGWSQRQFCTKTPAVSYSRRKRYAETTETLQISGIFPEVHRLNLRGGRVHTSGSGAIWNAFQEPLTIPTQIMPDEFDFLWSEIQNDIAEADADLIPVPGQFELHGGCRCGVLLPPCFSALYLSQI